MFGDPSKNTNSVKITDAFEIRDDLRKPINVQFVPEYIQEHFIHTMVQMGRLI